MMTVRLRLLGLLARWALTERRQPPQTVSRLALRCLWTDLDINRHMNNSRYLALMDLGRYHFMLVSGLGREVLWRRRWAPVVVRAEIDFTRSIQPGARFTLETRMARVGTKSAVLVQRFWLGDVLAAEAQVTALFTQNGKAQDLTALMAAFPDLVPAEPGDVPAGTGDRREPASRPG